MKVVVIGGGAAGFFAAINIAEKRKDAQVTILEKTGKLLSKVRVSGGGRCNVTHHCFEPAVLVQNYPRGHRELRQVFSRFNVQHTIEWFKNHGVDLKTEEDGRMFPRANTSEAIIHCFSETAARLGIQVKTGAEVTGIQRGNNGFEIMTRSGKFHADFLVCAAGGFAKSEGYNFIRALGHSVVGPIPSLFTFNLPGHPITKELQGVAVNRARVSLSGSRLSSEGPVLITHWGLSGPAVLRLSAFGAVALHEKEYRSEVSINWLPDEDQHSILDLLIKEQRSKNKAHPRTVPCFGLPRRLWEFLCDEAGIPLNKNWADLSKKELIQLGKLLTDQTFNMTGKTTFKEEFVTAGGIPLKEVDLRTMESKICPGLFFSGEVLDIDGITGGFNFQAAWSTAWLAADNIAIH